MLYLSTGNIRIDSWLLSIPIHTNCIFNEMVSTGDTEISLHIWAPLNSGGGGAGGGGVLQANSNPKCPNFHFREGGGELLQTNIPEKLDWGYSRDFEHRFIPLELAIVSQIVSHILRMYRLIRKRERAVIS